MKTTAVLAGIPNSIRFSAIFFPSGSKSRTKNSGTEDGARVRHRIAKSTSTGATRRFAQNILIAAAGFLSVRFTRFADSRVRFYYFISPSNGTRLATVCVYRRMVVRDNFWKSIAFAGTRKRKQAPPPPTSQPFVTNTFIGATCPFCYLDTAKTC